MSVYHLDDELFDFPSPEEADDEYDGLPWIDCQIHTDHLARFGAKEIPRAEYLLMLRDALKTY